MSTPLRVGWTSGWSSHLLADQLREQNQGVAVWTAASQSQRSAEQLARRAPLLAKRTLAAARAFVDRVRREQALALELLADHGHVLASRSLTTQPKGELLASRRAVRGAAARQRSIAHRAGRCRHGTLRRSVTRAVTHGICVLGPAHAEHSAASPNSSTATRSGRGNVVWTTPSASVQSSSNASTVLARQSWMWCCSVRSCPSANWPG